MSILKSGTIWVNIDEHEQGQHRVRKVERHGVLARGVLYYCCKPETGSALCDEQSDWHWLYGRGGVNLSHSTSISALEPIAGEGDIPHLLHGVAISGTYSLPHAADGHIFEFWCAHTEGQQSWMQALLNCLEQPDILPSPVPRSVMEGMVLDVKNRHVVNVNAGSGPKSTLGLVVTGIRIVSIVPGAPASMPLKDLRSNQIVKIEVGDSLIDVDGKPVTADNAPEILRGSDIVGSLARVRLEKKRGGPAGAGSVIEVRIARSSIARIKPLSEMVLAMAKVADPKTIGHVTPSQIHHMKELADEYVAIETRITTEYEARIRDLEALAVSEADISSAFCGGLLQSDAARRLAEEARKEAALLFSERLAAAEEAHESHLRAHEEAMRGRDCQLDSLRQKLADAEENVNQVAREREGTEAELAQARDGLIEVQARVDVSKRENEEWMAKVDELRGRAGVAEQRGLETASQLEAVKVELEAVKVELQGKAVELVRVKTLVDDKQRACGQCEEALKVSEAEQQRLQAMLQDTQMRLRSSQEELVESMRREQVLEGRIKDAQGDVMKANEERERGIAALARDLEATKKELAASKEGRQMIESELGQVKSAHQEVVRALENEKTASGASAREVAQLKEAMKKFEEELERAKIEQRAESQVVHRKIQDAIEKATADAEAKGAREVERLTASLQASAVDTARANLACQQKDALIKSLEAEVKTVNESLVALQDAGSATTDLERERAEQKRELESLRAASAGLEQLGRQRAREAEAAGAEMAALRQALEFAQSGKEGMETHNKEMVKSLKKLDMEVRDLGMELKTVDEALQRCAHAEHLCTGMLDEDKGPVPRADLIKSIHAELQARRSAYTELLDSQGAAENILKESLSFVSQAHAADAGAEAGKMSSSTLCEHAARVKATMVKFQEALTARESELHTCRERLGGFERRKDGNKDLQALQVSADKELTEALENCGMAFSGARDGLLEKARLVNSSLVKDFVKMQRTLDAALVVASDMLVRSDDTSAVAGLKSLMDAEADAEQASPPGARRSQAGLVRQPTGASGADLLSMLAQVRVLVERLARIRQLQGELELIDAAASRALSLSPAMLDVVHKSPVEKVNLLAGTFVDMHSAKFAWGPSEVMAQRLREIRLLSQDVLVTSKRSGVQGGVPTSARLGSDGRGAVPMGVAPAARLSVRGNAASDKQGSAGGQGEGRPYPFRGAVSMRHSGSGSAGGGSMPEAGESGKGLEAEGVRKEARGWEEAEAEADASLAAVRAVCDVCKEIDEVALDALGAESGQGSMSTADLIRSLALQYRQAKLQGTQNTTADAVEGPHRYLKDAVRTGSLFLFPGAFDKPAGPAVPPSEQDLQESSPEEAGTTDAVERTPHGTDRFKPDSAAARWIRLPSAAPHLVEHHAGAFLISRHKHNVYHDMLRQSADASAAESELIV